MATIIADGRTSNTAEVDSKNRLVTTSSTQTLQTAAALDGDAFAVNSAFVTLTSASRSGLIYIKNIDSVPWVVTRIFINIGNSTGGAGDIRAEVVSNPTTGTLITSGTAIEPMNENFGSPKLLAATTLLGAEGLTVTDGMSVVDTLIPSDASRQFIVGDPLVMPPSTQAALVITPQTGNTNMDVQVGFVLHRRVV